LTFVVDVLVPIEGSDGPRAKKRALVPRVEHPTLFAAKAWLGAHRHAFRSWLENQGEPYFEAWVHDGDGEPALHEHCPREGGGPDVVLTRSQLRAMRKTRVQKTPKPEMSTEAQLARAMAAGGPVVVTLVEPPPAVTEPVLNGHATNGKGVL